MVPLLISVRIYHYEASVTPERDLAVKASQDDMEVIWIASVKMLCHLSFADVPPHSRRTIDFVGKSGEDRNPRKLSNHAPFVWAGFRVCLGLFA